MGDMGLITGFISFVTLIIFIVMAANIGAMKNELRQITRFINHYSRETGIGMSYKCGSCGKSFAGKQKECPHCKKAVGW